MTIKETTKKLFATLYPELEIEVKSIDVYEISEMTEDCSFHPQLPAVFVGVVGLTSNVKISEIETRFELFTGYTYRIEAI